MNDDTVRLARLGARRDSDRRDPWESLDHEGRGVHPLRGREDRLARRLRPLRLRDGRRNPEPSSLSRGTRTSASGSRPRRRASGGASWSSRRRRRPATRGPGEAVTGTTSPRPKSSCFGRGFHVAFVTPDPGKTWDAWYTYLTEKHGLSKKPAFIGMSKGGVNEYDWTSVNPDKVSCIYADNPAIRPDAFAKLGELARRDVPLLNICGSLDFLLERHTLAIESRYHQLGGRITVMIKEGAAHHPHSLRNPKPIADWIEKNVRPAGDRPDFADETFTKSSYYSLADSYKKLEEEKTYAICRGPGFTECYDRYDATTKSQWGITGMAVIVPKTVAPGKPWVFRADRIGRDAAWSIWPFSPRGFTSSRPPSSRNPARCGSSGTPSTSSLPTTASPGSP